MNPIRKILIIFYWLLLALLPYFSIIYENENVIKFAGRSFTEQVGIEKLELWIYAYLVWVFSACIYLGKVGRKE